MTTRVLMAFCILSGLLNYGFGQTVYENNSYGFKAMIPNDWILYGEIKNDTLKNYSIVDWGLPKIYSELEKAEIENSISITGYKKIEIKNINNLIDFEFKRKKDVIKSKIVVDSVQNTSFIVNSTIRGLNYKSKIYFVYKNGTGYVINFTATPGTYDKNLMKFEEFYKNLKFPVDSLVKVTNCSQTLYAVEDFLLKEKLGNELPKPKKNPAFNGGIEELKKYFSAHPLTDEKAKQMFFIVSISFLVTCDGKAGNFQIITKGRGDLETYANQILAIVNKMPQNWQPAIKSGKPVDCYQVLSFSVLQGRLDKVSYR